ncbi:DUF4383 domain-containing protein [Frondihabitans australicus]|uniref:Uncharacterized protein DUF4383 n=1 Tax=Frondihabitans australicus TaxID=386892 RepID=A0A495ILM3_9MICO|nr:DUF4383 domain-containing protein [Frondihabitans australicus]RKR76066.1 uncharacterized protein DUF4383 [Frondihabitans australicus]
MIQSPNRLLGLFGGIVFLLLGFLGFFVATPLPFASTQGATVIGLFAGNGFLALIHVLIGALMLLSALGAAGVSKVVNMLVGIGLFLLGVFGVFLVHTSANIIAENSATIVLHLLFGLALAVVGLASGRLMARPATA